MISFIMTNEEVIKQLTENTQMTREIHGVLIGRPEYKQPGLIDEFKDVKETVRRHDVFILRGGGALAVVMLAIEVFAKFF